MSRASILTLYLSAACLLLTCQDPEKIPELEPGLVVEQAVDAATQQHVFGIDLSSEEVLHLEVAQHNLDIALDFYDPNSNQVLAVDSPNGRHGLEEFWWQAKVAGTHRLVVRIPPDRADGGHYRISALLHPSDRLTEVDQHRLAATLTRQRLKQGQAPEAVQALEQVVDHWRAAGELELMVLSLLRLAKQVGQRADDAELATLRQALELTRESGVDSQKRLQMRILRQLGQVHGRMGDRARAWELQQQAFDLAQAQGDFSAQAFSLNQMAQLEEARQAPRRALALYRSALELFHQSQRPRQVAGMLHNIGLTYGHLGKLDQALDALQEACALGRRFGSRQSLAGSRFQLAWIHHLSGQHERALSLFQQVLATYEELGFRRSRAAVLDRMGTVNQSLGRFETAGRLFAEVLSEAEHREDPHGRAHSTMNLAEIYLAQGRLGTAHDLISQAQANLQALPQDDPHGRAHTLLLESRVLEAQGRGVAALQKSFAALELIELLRLRTSQPSLTLPFFATRHEHFEHHVNLLLRLGQIYPESGYEAQALEFFERGRARSLIESIVRGDAEIRGSKSERDRVTDEMSQQALSGSSAEIRRLLDTLGDQQAAAAVAEPPVLKAPEIRELLDDSTLLLAYDLGPESSRVWSVDRQKIEIHDLVPAAQIESEVRLLLELMPRFDRHEEQLRWQLAVERLSAWLLGPVASRLPAFQRIVLLGDGAIHRLPMALLRNPVNRELLGASHEIVRVPSASLLAALRRRAAVRPNVNDLAIFADPVFRPPRRPPNVESMTRSVLRDLPRDFDPRTLPRLVGSRQEAATIAELWPEKHRWVALEEDASEHNLLASDLTAYSILHFATHAIQHSEHPELAAIVLSTPGTEGEVDGLLRAYEIASLRLFADLVVLSACRTALGKEVTGEGVLGLSRAFLHAGATSVVVSLWPVDDEATAAFMVAFYRALLIGGKSKSVALQQAQREIRETARWSHPFYWAAFELQGDWR